jgi:hypothetical protein
MKKIIKNNKLKYLKFIFVLCFILTGTSCTPEENECETKTVCYEGGSCIETPVPGNCY